MADEGDKEQGAGENPQQAEGTEAPPAEEAREAEGGEGGKGSGEAKEESAADGGAAASGEAQGGGDAGGKTEGEEPGVGEKRKADDTREEEDEESKRANPVPPPPPPAVTGYDAYGGQMTVAGGGLSSMMGGDPYGGGGGGGFGAVQALVDACISQGIIRPGELDQRVMDGLRSLPESDGISCMQEFMRSDMGRVRNKSAYLSGMVNRLKGQPSSTAAAYGTGGYGAPSAYGAYGQAPAAAGYGAYGAYGAQATYGAYGYAAAAPMGGNAPNFSVLSAVVSQTMEQLFLRGTVQRWEIDQKCVDGLQSLPDALAVEAIQDFSCRDLMQIRNKSAYFMGCINKRKDNLAMGGGAAGAGGLPTLAGLTGSGEAANSPAVREKLESMFATGVLPRETLDYRAWSEFSKLKEAQAFACIDEFVASDQSRIRNKAAYFMGICKKHQQQGGFGF